MLAAHERYVGIDSPSLIGDINHRVECSLHMRDVWGSIAYLSNHAMYFNIVLSG